MHPRPQGTRVEAQDRCGPDLSLDAPSGFRKDLKNVVSLRLFLCLPNFLEYRSMKAWTIRGMPSFRSRNGGTVMGKTLTR
jgi:hypothetical protein